MLLIFPIDTPSSGLISSCEPFDQNVTMTFANLGVSNINGVNLYYRVNGGTEIMETYNNTITPFENVTYTFNTPITVSANGNYTVETRVELSGDQATANDIQQTTFNATLPFDPVNGFQENFESNIFPPNGWSINNIDNAQTWEQISVIGSDGNNTLAAYIENYFYNAPDAEDELASIPIDLSNNTSAQLSFDLAYAPFSNDLFDEMRVDIYTDCGNQFYSTVYNAANLDLATVPGPISTNWTPTNANEWRNEVIDLSGVLGESIVIKFVGINGYGNNLFLDNINLTGTYNSQPPNPIISFSVLFPEILSLIHI